jgi:hypothetical protein
MPMFLASLYCGTKYIGVFSVIVSELKLDNVDGGADESLLPRKEGQG